MKVLQIACLSLSGLVGCSGAFAAPAEDWPQHLGPTQDAVSAETGLLNTWPEEGPPELWRHDVGKGFAGTAVVDGKVFLNDREQGVADILRVFDLETGEELWQYKHGAPGRVNFPGSRSTPSVTGTHVYTTGALGDIHAINRKTKKPDWSIKMWEKYPDNSQSFGYGPSAVIIDDLLLLSPTAQGDPVVIAVDPKTGEDVWQSEATLTTNQTHHTPVLRTIAGVRGISCRDQTHLYHIDIKTGKTIWSHQVYGIVQGPHVTIPPVTVIGKKNQYVFVTNGYENGSALYEVTTAAAEGEFEIRELYRTPEGSQVHPAIYHDKHFYVNINENANLRGRNKQGGLACFDANNGELKWKTQNEPNLNRGAVTLADGKLYVFDGDTGELMLVNANPDQFDVIAKFEALKPEGRSNNAWSPIVVSDGRLIIRDHRQIVCYDLREKKAQR
ncbi:MAG: PQQ-binding-like beta-propeller repeat protein [Phycisphaeraceae bacterium]|nr:PQQ-binding-like beta-propeller repeat protein [Phycisphaeraceae bacterium]